MTSSSSYTGTLRLTRTYQCGHTDVRLESAPTDREDTLAVPVLCDECARNPAIVAARRAWERAGYPSAEIYQAAIEHDRAVSEIERQRAVDLAALAALPESARPFTTRAPLSGAPTLDDLAAENGESL